MAKLTVNQNQHDFKLNPLPLPIQAKNGALYFRFRLSKSCWYNNLGNDNFDFNKACGVYKFWDFKKNQNALILGWRPRLSDPNFFEIVPYENINGAIVANENKMRLLKVDEDLFGCFNTNPAGNWQLWVKEDGQYNIWHRSALIAKIVGKISAWFGGNQTAPQKMELELDF
jgi:hypothetical protein